MQRLTILLGLLPLLLGACVYDRTGRSGSSMIVRDVQANQVAVDRVRGEVEGERSRIDAIEERGSLARRNMAKSTATAENLVESVQALAGELQNLRHLIEKGQTLDADLDYRLADIAFRLMTVEEKLGIEPEVYMPDEEEAAEGAEGDPAEAGIDGASAEAEADGVDGGAEETDVVEAMAIPVDEELDIPLDPEAASEGSDPNLNLLARALQAMQVDNFAQAGRALTEFLEQHPDSERSADARILLGDCLFELDRFNEAISEYEIFIQLAPQHARVPSAMLSQGLAFIELGTESDLQAARVFLDDLIEVYPDSPEAERARRKIQILE